jgi:hypothetical protein
MQPETKKPLRWIQLCEQTGNALPVCRKGGVEEVEALYDPAQERLQHQNYRIDLEPRKVKECL